MTLSLQRPRLFLTAAAIMLCFGAAGGALAQGKPDTENGRYTLSPTPDGVLRLDTRSGAVSTCNDKHAGWACYAMPDERAALDAEIGRLQSEIDVLRKDNVALKQDVEALRAQLGQREPTVSGKIDEPLPKQDSLKTPELKSEGGSRKLEIPLPSDRDVDRVIGFLENAWKRLIEMVSRVQKDASGKI